MRKFASIVRYFVRHSFVRFGFIGACGYVVGVAVLAFGMGPLKLDFAPANALAIFIAMAFTWQGNRHFTFPMQRARGLAGAMKEWLKFMGANSLGALANYITALALVHFAPVPLSDRFVAQALGVLVGLVFNFTLSRSLVFRGTP